MNLLGFHDIDEFVLINPRTKISGVTFQCHHAQYHSIMIRTLMITRSLAKPDDVRITSERHMRAIGETSLELLQICVVCGYLGVPYHGSGVSREPIRAGIMKIP